MLLSLNFLQLILLDSVLLLTSLSFTTKFLTALIALVTLLSKLSMTLSLNWTLYQKKVTKILLSSCNFFVITSLYGLRICKNLIQKLKIIRVKVSLKKVNKSLLKVNNKRKNIKNLKSFISFNFFLNDFLFFNYLIK